MSAKVAPYAAGKSEQIETSPKSDVEMGQGGSFTDEQSILVGDRSCECNRIDTIDEAVKSACEDPGIFLVIWARRGGCCITEYCVMVISIIIQVVVPSIIVGSSKSPFDDINGKSGLEVKVTAFALSLYLMSTYTGTMSRISANACLMSTIPGTRWALALANANLYACIFLTTYATFVLFKQQPDVKDILMNCVSLNFLPEADVQLVRLLKASTTSKFGVASSRLDKLVESWTETKARDLVQKFAELTLVAQIKRFPLIIFFDMFNKFFVGLTWVEVVAIGIFV